MALKDRLHEAVEELGYTARSISVKRDETYNGIPSWYIVVEWTNQNEQTYKSEFHIAKANGMDDEHIAKVVKSYLRADPVRISEEVEE